MSKAKSRLSVLLVIAMVLAMFPLTAFAAESTPAAPSGDGVYFFANGTPVTITGEKPVNSDEVKIDGFTATGTDAYILWDKPEGGVNYIGVSEDTRVYGGSDGRSEAVTVESTSIAMDGGQVSCLFGGNLGMKDKAPAHTSVVTGDTNIVVEGDTAKVALLLHGGGQFNSAVKGTAYIDVIDADLTYTTDSGALDGCYINGGTNGNGSEGTRNIDEGTITTEAVVNNAVIRIVDSKALLVGGGGSGSTKVGEAMVTISGSEVEYVYLTGINGEISYVSMNITDSEIGSMSASNRGFVELADVNIAGSSIDTLNTGAATGCFTSDSGSNDATGVTNQVNWYLDADTTVEEANFTPYIRNNGGTYTAEVSNTYISKVGDPIELNMVAFQYDANETGALVSDYLLPAESSFSFDGVALTIPQEVKLTSKGYINVGPTSSLSVAEGALDAAKGSIFVYDGAKVEGVSEDQILKFYNFQISAGAGGQISPFGEISRPAGDTLELTITPDEGYVIADVTVNGVSKGAVSKLTLEDISESAVIVASFKAAAAPPADQEDPGDQGQTGDKGDPAEEAKPEQGTPETGDSSNVLLWVTLAAVCVLGGAYSVNRIRANTKK